MAVICTPCVASVYHVCVFVLLIGYRMSIEVHLCKFEKAFPFQMQSKGR